MRITQNDSPQISGDFHPNYSPDFAIFTPISSNSLKKIESLPTLDFPIFYFFSEYYSSSDKTLRIRS